MKWEECLRENVKLKDSKDIITYLEKILYFKNEEIAYLRNGNKKN